jgi:undecaprenyl diphosphate synthase
MDGNGRWAVGRGLPRNAGHQAGVQAIKDVVRACPDLGVDILTIYAFSTENWKRPKDEVDALMWLLVEYCRSQTEELRQNGVRINAIGRIDQLPPLQQSEVRRAVEATSRGDRLTLNIAINYGARAELVDAVRRIAEAVQAGSIRPEEIDTNLIESHLYTAGQPSPDLIIRTGGEMRLSNFLLWQAAYSEIWVTPVLWPDFRREHLEEALADFGKRERRFGAVLRGQA